MQINMQCKVLLVVFFPFTSGFLLENNIHNNSGIGQKSSYVTLSEFYEYKKQDSIEMRHLTDQLRDDNDKTLALLTSQLQQKFSALEQKVYENCQHNESKCSSSKLDTYNKELKDNNTRLQHDFDKLMTKYTQQENELLLLKDELLLLRNETEKLEQLKAINQLQDLQNVKQQLQSIASQTNKLTVNERARSQDFLALYNETLVTKRDIRALNTSAKNWLSEIKTKHGASVDNLNKTIGENGRKIQMISRNIQEQEQRFNRTSSDIRKQLEMVSEKVTVTACRSTDHTYNSRDVIKFDDIKVQVGISDLSSFTSSGIFKCEKPGLYLVSLWIISNKAGHFNPYKNGSVLFYTYIHDSYERSTIVFAVELGVGDLVWVETDGIEVDSWGSCMTVTKIN